MPPRSVTSARRALEMRVSLSSRRTSPLVFDHPLLQGTIAPLSPGLRSLQLPGVAQCCASLTPAIHYMRGTMSSKF